MATPELFCGVHPSHSVDVQPHGLDAISRQHWVAPSRDGAVNQDFPAFATREELRR